MNSHQPNNSNAVISQQIEQHSGRASFIWLVKGLPGAVVFLDIVADITAAIKVTGALVLDRAKGVVL